MIFMHDGQKYSMTFTRRHQQVRVFQDVTETVTVVIDGKEVTAKVRIPVERQVKSRHPFTTVRLDKLFSDGGRETWKQETVGCIPTDKFDIEDGRVKALQKLNSQIPRDMLKPMWEAYHKRPKQRNQKGNPPTPVSTTATPVITPIMAMDLHAPVNSYMVH